MNQNNQNNQNFKPLTLVEMDDLLEGLTLCKANITGRDIARLERENFVMVYGGDSSFSKMQSFLKYVELKQFDVETWYLKRMDYVITNEDREFMNSNCRYNGNVK